MTVEADIEEAFVTVVEGALTGWDVKGGRSQIAAGDRKKATVRFNPGEVAQPIFGGGSDIITGELLVTLKADADTQDTALGAVVDAISAEDLLENSAFASLLGHLTGLEAIVPTRGLGDTPLDTVEATMLYER